MNETEFILAYHMIWVSDLSMADKLALEETALNMRDGSVN